MSQLEGETDESSADENLKIQEARMDRTPPKRARSAVKKQKIQATRMTRKRTARSSAMMTT
jgi:hypothetical protein